MHVFSRQSLFYYGANATGLYNDDRLALHTISPSSAIAILGMMGLIPYSSRGGRGDVQGGGGDGGGSLEGGLIFFHTTMLSSSSSSMLAVAPVSSSVVASAGILKSENVFLIN